MGSARLRTESGQRSDRRRLPAPSRGLRRGGPTLPATTSTPHAALTRWINLFVDFLVTRHGLAEALRSDDAAFETLYAYFIGRLVPVCAQLLEAAAEASEIRRGVDTYELLPGVGNLCIGAENDARYDARRMVELLIAGRASRRSPCYREGSR